MTEITLNDAEQRLAKYVAKHRYRNARSRNKVDAKIGPQSNWETDLEGIAGEIAFCKHMNVYPDLDTDLETLPDVDAWHVLLDRVDVKTTAYHTGRLLAVLSKKGHATDTYALMIGKFPTYRFVGFASASELFKDENIKDLGRGNGYAMDQDQLRSMP